MCVYFQGVQGRCQFYKGVQGCVFTFGVCERGVSIL